MSTTAACGNQRRYSTLIQINSGLRSRFETFFQPALWSLFDLTSQAHGVLLFPQTKVTTSDLEHFCHRFSWRRPRPRRELAPSKVFTFSPSLEATSRQRSWRAVLFSITTPPESRGYRFPFSIIPIGRPPRIQSVVIVSYPIHGWITHCPILGVLFST